MSLGPAGGERTSHPEVDAALGRLAALDALPVAEQVAVYDEVQQRLTAALDDTQDPRPPTEPR